MKAIRTMYGCHGGNVYGKGCKKTVVCYRKCCNKPFLVIDKSKARVFKINEGDVFYFNSEKRFVTEKGVCIFVPSGKEK
jgi:hypothetical protein